MVEIKIEKVPYSLPTVWSEITLSQYRQMVQHKMDLSAERLLSILTGIDYETLLNFDASQFKSEEIFGKMTFVNKQFDPLKEPRQKVLNFGGREVPVIDDPRKERLGQKLRLQQIMARSIKNKLDFPEIAAEVLATYYAPYLNVNNSWKEEEVINLIPIIESMPVEHVLPEADFFLRGYILRSRKRSVSKFSQMRKK